MKTVTLANPPSRSCVNGGPRTGQTMGTDPKNRREEGVRRPRHGWLASLSMRDAPGQTSAASNGGSLAHRLTQAAVLLGMIAAVVGAGHLAAWLGGYMSQRGLSAITMKTNAALGLTLVGVALILLVPAKAGPVRRWTARVCAALALAVGLLTFVENLSGWDFGIDQLLAVETPGALAGVDPNRMGVPASLSFTLIGLSLLILSRRDRRGARAVPALALAVCLIALWPIIGFLYGAQEFYGIAQYTGIAWPTAVALLLLGLGLLCARPAEGLMAQVTADDPGGVSLRRLLPAFVLVPLLLGWLRLAGERAGVFDAATGTGIMMLVFIITFTALAYHAGRRASRSAQTLRESERFIQSVAQASPHWLYVFDFDRRSLSYANRPILRDLGYPLEVQRTALTLEAFRAFMPAEEMPHLARLMEEWQTLPDGQIRADEYCLRRADGELQYFAGREAVFARRADGTVQQILGLLLDITARQRAEEALRELNATLESKVAQRTAQLQRRARQLQKLALELSQAEERERRRIAVILHEDFQQQIAGAKFQLNLVRNRAREDRLRAEVDKVGEMLNEAIEKSRSLSHDLSPAVLHMNDLAEVLQWLVNQVRARHGLVVHVNASGDMMLHSEALALFLFRAAQEMLFNVVKHAHVREAAIRVRRIGRYVCLSVSDQGRGFDPQELQETSGVGLFSIRERTEMLGGRMKVKSTKGQGSRFRLVVPDSQKAEDTVGVGPRAYPVSTTPGHHGGEEGHHGVGFPNAEESRLGSRLPLRVLLVDDHDIVRQGLAALLQEAPDIEVIGEAADGREAINMVSELHPDVVIMDVSMPLMSGDQATRQIKAYLPKIRVIALSMYDEADKKERMYQAGAEGYILKTVSAEELLAAIRGTQARPQGVSVE